MNDKSTRQIEQDLLRILSEEYSFYQSLYILLDRQRDLIKYDKDEHLLDLFAEIERCHMRIKESERKVTELRERTPAMFTAATMNPEVKKMVNSITTLVKKNMSLVAENEGYVKDRHDRLRKELEELKNSDKIMQYLRQNDTSPQFVDGTR
jgi:cell division septum initiation protein DivIVA